VTFADDQEVSGYEDALAVDEDFLTGDLLPIKIHVYPTAFLRNIHIELSVLILTSLLLCAFASLLYQVVWGEGN
ncbi:putative transmembrane protein, partial [Toxoplasma gondii RUB]